MPKPVPGSLDDMTWPSEIGKPGKYQISHFRQANNGWTSSTNQIVKSDFTRLACNQVVCYPFTQPPGGDHGSPTLHATLPINHRRWKWVWGAQKRLQYMRFHDQNPPTRPFRSYLRTASFPLPPLATKQTFQDVLAGQKRPMCYVLNVQLVICYLWGPGPPGEPHNVLVQST